MYHFIIISCVSSLLHSVLSISLVNSQRIGYYFLLRHIFIPVRYIVNVHVSVSYLKNNNNWKSGFRDTYMKVVPLPSLNGQKGKRTKN